MPASDVIEYAENFDTMTNEQGLAFIDKMRRQLDRFEVAVPGVNGRPLPPGYDEEIRRICDQVERNIRERLSSI